MKLTFARNYEGMDVEELEFEKQDLYGAIENEKWWAKSAYSKVDENMHAQNILSLRQEIEYIDDLIKELKANESEA